MIETRKIKIDHDTFGDYVSEMFSDHNKIKESKSGYTSVPLDMFGNWVVYRYKIKEKALDIVLKWKPKKIKEKYIEVEEETLYGMARDLEWNSIPFAPSCINQIFYTKYPIDTIFAFIKSFLKNKRKGKLYFKRKYFVLKQVYENWVEYNNDPENSKTHRVYERKE